MSNGKDQLSGSLKNLIIAVSRLGFKKESVDKVCGITGQNERKGRLKGAVHSKNAERRRKR